LNATNHDCYKIADTNIQSQKKQKEVKGF
jgi:hypothetical protein